MNEQEIRKIVDDEIRKLINGDIAFIFQKPIQILDGRNIQLGRNNGTQIGTATDQKIGLYGTVPIVQQSAIGKPSAGTNIDGEARAAIDSIIDFLTKIGLTK